MTHCRWFVLISIVVALPVKPVAWAKQNKAMPKKTFNILIHRFFILNFQPLIRLQSQFCAKFHILPSSHRLEGINDTDQLIRLNSSCDISIKYLNSDLFVVVYKCKTIRTGCGMSYNRLFINAYTQKIVLNFHVKPFTFNFILLTSINTIEVCFATASIMSDQIKSCVH